MAFKSPDNLVGIGANTFSGDATVEAFSTEISLQNIPDTVTTPIRVRKNSAGSTLTRRRINFIEGSNVTITIADDSTDDEVDVTIAASGEGGGDGNPALAKLMASLRA